VINGKSFQAVLIWRRSRRLLILLLGCAASKETDEVLRLLSGLKRKTFRFCIISKETTLLCPAREALLR